MLRVSETYGVYGVLNGAWYRGTTGFAAGAAGFSEVCELCFFLCVGVGVGAAVFGRVLGSTFRVAWRRVTYGCLLVVTLLLLY